MIVFQVILLWNIFHATFPFATIIEGAILPNACKDITFVNSSDGIYTIYPTGDLKRINVQCDMKTDGGGWTVITYRKNWKMDFNRSWTEYRDGFGSPDDSYWIVGVTECVMSEELEIRECKKEMLCTWSHSLDGNKYIHDLTAGRNTEVYFALDFTNGSSRYAKYKNFTIGSEEEKFKITYDGASYTGDAGNALYGSADSRYYPARMFFTTYDHDSDRNPYSNCASDWGGGWWFNYCHQTCLTGTPGTAGYQWHGIGSGRIYRLSASRIMIR